MKPRFYIHSEILKKIATEQFASAFEREVMPQLISIFGESLGEAVMYDHYLELGMSEDGEWYYPLTVVLGGTPGTVYVKWQITESFENGMPYALVGDGEVGFLVCTAPDSVKLEVSGRRIYHNPEAIHVGVTAALPDPMMLVGRFSQSFLDALAEQITDRLRETLRIEDFSTSTIELELCFARDTYMEHTSEGVTYRRLLLTDKGCRPRDFWVRWTRCDGAEGAVSVSDDISPSTVRFELGEDAPQRVREKEFRYLCRANPDKYQSAMGKRMVTEWRELIKRALKRGELVQLPAPEKQPEDDIELRLRSVLGVTDTTAEAAAPEVNDDDITAMARAALGESLPEEEAPDYSSQESTVDAEDELIFGLDIPEEIEDTPEKTIYTEPDYSAEEPEPIELPQYTEPEAEPCCEPEYIGEPEDIEEPRTTQRVETDAEREERIRREVEARVRLEYEAEARARAEREAEELRAESERLRAENQRLIDEARAREAEERARLERERLEAEEKERLEREKLERERLEAEERARLEKERLLEEQKERERLAEAARIAVEEQRRREIENEQRERLRREELEREERESRERENARRLAEEEAKRKEREAEAALVTKHAKLIFRRPVDLNVIKEIKTIVEKTLISENKHTIKIHIKAFPVDSYTINLDITLPGNEGELLVTLIKAIGNGGVGITKIIVE